MQFVVFSELSFRSLLHICYGQLLHLNKHLNFLNVDVLKQYFLLSLPKPQTTDCHALGNDQDDIMIDYVHFWTYFQ